MFRWLFRRNRKPKTSNRLIFHFHDGTRSRSVDPVRVVMSLDTDPQYNADRHLRMIEVGDAQDVKEATEIICNAYCRAFGVSVYDEKTRIGLTVSEILALGAVFSEWLDTVKKNIKPSLI